MEGSRHFWVLSRVGRPRTLKRRKAYERMNPILQKIRGTVSKKNHIGLLETTRAKWEQATKYAGYFDAYNTLQSD
jgi:anthranilate phosphoribosyltransferase